MGNVSASADTQRYLDGYPGEPDDPNKNKNLEFYSNQRPSKPDGTIPTNGCLIAAGDYIEEIHKKWRGKYGLLEAHHGYIQWLFPIREDGLNHYAQKLQLHEAEAIKSNKVLQDRVITSYDLMLDFYGMRLVDRNTGEITRSEDWKARYAHLNRSFHNYLRITRILKCLGEVGLEHFKKHFVKHVLIEMFENRELLNCYESCVKYWLPVLRNEEERKELQELVMKYEEKNPRRQMRRPMWDSDEEEEDEDKRAGDEKKVPTSGKSTADNKQQKQEEEKDKSENAQEEQTEKKPEKQEEKEEKEEEEDKGAEKQE